MLYGPIMRLLGQEAALYPEWWFFTGAMLVGAATLAALSLQSISFDLKERHYRRRQGPGLLPRAFHGSINNIDALVLISEPNGRMVSGSVTYHLVLHWKNKVEPPMVVQQDTRLLGTGQPLNYAAGPILAAGSAYAKAMGVAFYDNSHFPSPCPVSVFT